MTAKRPILPPESLSEAYARGLVATVRALHPPGKREAALLDLWRQNRRENLRAWRGLLAWLPPGPPPETEIPVEPPAWWRELARRAEEPEA